MIGITAALSSFAAGIISFLSPCVLPLVPGYVSYIAGETLADPKADGIGCARRVAFLLSLCFVLGFSTVFVILGASATALGQLLLSYRYEANFIAGGAVVLFGLMMMGLVRWSWVQRDVRFRLNLPGGRPVAAFALGLAFAFGWTPCIGPVLGTILTTSAVAATVAQGIVLLILYSLGLGLPFIGAALFTDRLFECLRRLRRAGRLLQLGAGGVMVGMGVAILTGQLTDFSHWLLDTFPIFTKIG